MHFYLYILKFLWKKLFNATDPIREKTTLNLRTTCLWSIKTNKLLVTINHINHYKGKSAQLQARSSWLRVTHINSSTCHLLYRSSMLTHSIIINIVCFSLYFALHMHARITSLRHIKTWTYCISNTTQQICLEKSNLCKTKKTNI